MRHRYWMTLIFVTTTFAAGRAVVAAVGVGAAPLAGAETIIDGTREQMDEKWTYWKGPRFASSLPIKWPIVADPVDDGTVIMSHGRSTPEGRHSFVALARRAQRTVKYASARQPACASY